MISAPVVLAAVLLLACTSPSTSPSSSPTLDQESMLSLPPSFKKFNTDINSPDVEIVVLTSEQYHFVPLGSYFQHTLNSFEYHFDSAFLSHRTPALTQ